MLGDITSKRLLWAKGFLFLFAGCLAVLLLLLEAPNWKVAALLAVAIWCFARFYYFAFYVVERYIDPSFKFAGLASVVRYLFAKRRSAAKADARPSGSR
jgi:hypothetical protein